MNLSDVGIDEAELRQVVDSMLARVTPAYAAARLESCLVVGLHTPSGSHEVVILLRLASRSAAATRGQYFPLTDCYNRGLVDECLVGAICGHWQAAHRRDLFREMRFVIDVRETSDALPLYSFVDVDDARIRGLIPSGSPIDAAIRQYQVRRLLQVGDHLGGPSPGLVELVANEAERIGAGRFLDAFAGSCVLSRVALEHGIDRAVCVDTMLDEAVAYQNLGVWSSRAELRRMTLRSGLDSGVYDLVALDPFYDHALVAIHDFGSAIGGGFRTAIINLGLALPTAWQDRLTDAIAMQMSIEYVCELYGERIAICTPRDDIR